MQSIPADNTRDVPQVLREIQADFFAFTLLASPHLFHAGETISSNPGFLA